MRLLVCVAMLALTLAHKPDTYRALDTRHPRHRQVSMCTGAGLFRCASGQCIEESWVCDGQDDCQDGTDEVHCAQGCTGPRKFQCAHTPQCIPASLLCNGRNDCHDHSDERNCHLQPCGLGKARCASGQCVQRSFFCDGMADCRDGSDERNCTHCQMGYFLCVTSAHCIYGAKRCDGIDDCVDRSDEAGCDDGSTCSDARPVQYCRTQNQTARPICLDPDRASRDCQNFCELCPED